MYELPKKYKRTEAKVDGPILEWLLKNYPRSFGLEVKVDDNKLIQHQNKALKEVESGRFGYKIPDMGRRNPLDAVGIINGDALVCTATGKDVECRVNNTHTIRFSLSKRAP